VCRWKNYENRSIFSKDMDKSIVCGFFWATLYSVWLSWSECGPGDEVCSDCLVSVKPDSGLSSVRTCERCFKRPDFVVLWIAHQLNCCFLVLNSHCPISCIFYCISSVAFRNSCMRCAVVLCSRPKLYELEMPSQPRFCTLLTTYFFYSRLLLFYRLLGCEGSVCTVVYTLL